MVQSSLLRLHELASTSRENMTMKNKTTGVKGGKESRLSNESGQSKQCQYSNDGSEQRKRKDSDIF